jgi:hypothetical protein
MRKLSRGRVLFPLSSVLAVAVWAACGGSDGSSVIDQPDAGDDTGAELADTGPVLSFPDVAPPPPDAAEAGPTPLLPFDGGPIQILDGGPGVDGGIPCFASGELEQEPNDDLSTANKLRPIRCGVVMVPPDGGENDYLTFTVPDSWSGFNLYYDGKISAVVTVDGAAPVDITQQDRLSLVTGQPYYVQIRSRDGQIQVWKIILVRTFLDGGSSLEAP